MILTVLPYLLISVLIGSAAVLLTSKKLSQRLVTAGILPRTFLGFIPILQNVIRVFGGLLIVAGAIKIASDSGWINVQLLSQYGFPACLIMIGAMLLFLNRRH